MFEREKENLSVTKLTEYIAGATALLYLLGFAVWYFYLSMLGFSQFDLVQIRYILTGLLVLFVFLFLGLFILLFIQIVFWVCRLIVFFLRYLPDKSISFFRKISSKTQIKFKKIFHFFHLFRIAPIVKHVWSIIGFIIFGAFLLISFATIVFPLIPSKLGGGQPKVIALIAATDTLRWLSDFGVPTMEKQTGNMCVVYENNDVIIIALTDRVLEFDKKIFIGKSSIPSKQVEEDRFKCGELAQSYLFPNFRQILQQPLGEQ